MATSNLIRKIAQKGKDGVMLSPLQVGVNFENVIDERVGKGNYSLAQLFDSYIDFMKNANFIYTGITKPVNQNVSIWIDTSVTNHDTYGVK